MNLSNQQLEKIVLQFNETTLPKESWTHEAHLAVACWHCSNFSEKAALTILRQKIIQYNEVIGTLNSENSGYHETLTVFWLNLVRRFLKARKYPPLAETINDLHEAGLVDPYIPLHYYSMEKLFDRKARMQWEEPDLKSLKFLYQWIDQLPKHIGIGQSSLLAEKRNQAFGIETGYARHKS